MAIFEFRIGNKNKNLGSDNLPNISAMFNFNMFTCFWDENENTNEQIHKIKEQINNHGNDKMN